MSPPRSKITLIVDHSKRGQINNGSRSSADRCDRPDNLRAGWRRAPQPRGNVHARRVCCRHRAGLISRHGCCCAPVAAKDQTSEPGTPWAAVTVAVFPSGDRFLRQAGSAGSARSWRPARWPLPADQGDARRWPRRLRAVDRDPGAPCGQYRNDGPGFQNSISFDCERFAFRPSKRVPRQPAEWLHPIRPSRRTAGIVPYSCHVVPERQNQRRQCCLSPAG